jgi:hypothetical protein
MLNKHDHQYDSIRIQNKIIIDKKMKEYFFMLIQDAHAIKHAVFFMSYSQAYLESTEQKCSLKISIDMK